MTASPLLSKPDFTSTLTLSRRLSFEKSVGQKVKEYFRDRWPWPSDEEKQIGINEDTDICVPVMCPRGPEDRVEAISMLVVFAFLYDDLMESMSMSEAKESLENVKNVVFHSASPKNPIEEVVHNICTRIRSLSAHDSEYHNQLAERGIAGILGQFEAAMNREEKTKSLEGGLEVFIKYRVKDIGFWPYIRVNAWQMELVELPQHIWDDPDFTTLTDLTMVHQLLVNDLYSYRRESNWSNREDKSTPDSANAELVFNAISVLLQQEDVDESNVLQVMYDHIHSNERKIMEVAEKLRTKYEGGDKEDFDALNDWIIFLNDNIAGNVVWSQLCRRYNSV